MRHSKLTRRNIKIEKEVEQMQSVQGPKSKWIKFILQVVRVIIFPYIIILIKYSFNNDCFYLFQIVGYIAASIYLSPLGELMIVDSKV